MIWWPSVNNAPVSATASVSSNGTIVTVTTTADITTVPESGGLVIGSNPPVEVKRGYLDGSIKRIELVKPWPYTNQTNQSCTVYPTDFNVADEVAKLKNSGTDNANSALFLNTLSTSTANTVTLDLLNQADVTAVPVGKLNAGLNTKRNAMSAIGRDLYSTDRQGEALAIFGEQPNVVPVPLLDLNFAENEYKVYENGFLVDKTLTEVLTTTRNSTATYDSPFGIGTAGVNEPRITFDPNTGENLGLLAEEQRTNLLLWSEQFDNSWWDKIGSTVEANAELSPNLTNTVDKIVETSTNSVHRVQKAITGLPGAEFSATIFVKGDGSRKIGLTFGANDLSSFGSAIVNPSNGQATTHGGGGGAVRNVKVEKYGNGYFRVTLTVTNIASTAHRFVVSILPASATTIFDNYQGDGESGLYIWGAQLEVGSFSTSYIPTQASQVTRVIDNCKVVASNPTRKNGTVFLDLKGYVFNGATTSNIIEISNTERNERIEIRISNSNTLNLVLTSVSGVQTSSTFSYGRLIAFCYDSNVVRIFRNGSLVTTINRQLNFNNNSISINQNNISAGFSIGGRLFLGKLKLYPYALSDADLIDLTKL